MEHYLLGTAFAALAGGLIVVAVLLVRQQHIAAVLRRRNDELAAGVRIRDEELRHLVATRLPELAESLHDRPVTVSGPRHEGHLDGTLYGQALRAAMDLFAAEVAGAKEHAEKSAKATLRAMMRAAQSLANEQQLAISTMQDRHDDPDVLQDLLRIDHMNSQIGRRAQATAVLCGSWPGQQRAASPLTDVVRGATSRIRDYLRVNVSSEMDVAVVGRAVEPAVLALAELLDNAARHSRPNTSVEVNFQQAHNGVAVMIDDAGVAMDAEELRQADALLSRRRSVDINRLGDPPQVGFAVCGVLAERYGFTVSVDTRSPYGGVRAVVFLPSTLLTRIPGDGAAGGAGAAIVRAAEPAGAPAAAPVPERVAPASKATAGGLPRRRRADAATGDRADATGDRADAAAIHADAAPGDRPDAAAIHANAAAARTSEGAGAGEAVPAERAARQVAAGLGAWQRGTRSGRAVAPLDSEGEDLRP